MKRVLVLAIVLASSPAHASPLFELVGDPLGSGGLTGRVSATDASAAYFNPALLTDAPIGFDLGTFFVTEQIGMTLDGRDSSADVPSVQDRGPESFRHQGGGPIENPTMPTAWLQQGHGLLLPRPRQNAGSGQQSHAYQTLGLVEPVFRGRLMLGMFAMIPLGQFTTASAFYNDEREQYFSNSLHPELYGDRLTATSLAFGGGFRIRHDLSVGATFTLSLANTAAVPVYVSNLSNLDTVLLDSDIGVKAAVAPHFGVSWKPNRHARVVATVHTKQSFEISTGFDYVLATGNEQSTTLHFTHSYMPLTIATGGSYSFGDFTATALLTYAQWSHYRDRHATNPGGEYGWSDTITPAAGVRWDHGPLRGWLDLAYNPSPVPPQTGRTNYVDNDRISASGGADRTIKLWGSQFRVGVDLVADHLFYRHVTKFLTPAGNTRDDLVQDEVPDDSVDVVGSPVAGAAGLQTNNPGFPGYASSGWILGGGLHVAVEY
jgi:long-chain fatty acid transport protein